MKAKAKGNSRNDKMEFSVETKKREINFPPVLIFLTLTNIGNNNLFSLLLFVVIVVVVVTAFGRLTYKNVMLSQFSRWLVFN